MNLSVLLEKAQADGFLSLDEYSSAELRIAAQNKHFSVCTEAWPNVVVVENKGIASVEMDTYCFGPGSLDEQACGEALALIVNITSDQTFQCGTSFFKAERVPIEDAATLARALINVALRAKARSAR
jgi:hypothetical protein